MFQMIHVAPALSLFPRDFTSVPDQCANTRYLLYNVHLVINDLSLSLYRMLAELCNTKNSRYFDGKRVLNDGIHTSMVTV